jgi:hypothetical protein
MNSCAVNLLERPKYCHFMKIISQFKLATDRFMRLELTTKGSAMLYYVTLHMLDYTKWET